MLDLRAFGPLHDLAALPDDLGSLDLAQTLTEVWLSHHTATVRWIEALAAQAQALDPRWAEAFLRRLPWWFDTGDEPYPSLDLTSPQSLPQFQSAWWARGVVPSVGRVLAAIWPSLQDPRLCIAARQMPWLGASSPLPLDQRVPLPLPAPETLQGIQARLNLRGWATIPPFGQLDEATFVALHLVNTQQGAPLDDSAFERLVDALKAEAPLTEAQATWARSICLPHETPDE